jgi:hypothetical protein
MFSYHSSNRRRAIFLALVFVLIQSYVLYSSTFHVFHSSMPMCPVCAAIKSYQSSIVDTATPVLIAFRYYVTEKYFSPQIVRFVEFHYQSRAPPV